MSSTPTSSTTIRIPGAALWPRVPDLVQEAIGSIRTPFAPACAVDHVRSCTAIINDAKKT
jgi:hypothetical protein